MKSFFDKPASSKILSVAIPRPLEGLFTYFLPEEWVDQVKIGAWVYVPFGKGVTHAFIVEEPKSTLELPAHIPLNKVKNVLSIGTQEPVFTPDVLALCRWAHEYYQVPLGEILHCAAPPASLGLKSVSNKVKKLEWEVPVSATPLSLNSDQRNAVEKFWLHVGQVNSPTSVSKFPKVLLLDGITGSGKTEVYLEIAKEVISKGKGVIFLVPEIALTTQLHRRIEAGLNAPVAHWHSAVPDAKRRDFASALRTKQIRAVIGARSAVFAPVPDLGLIIVDEEHDQSYKQEDRVRYHARDLAVVRSKISEAPIVLGSATPSLETLERVREGKYASVKLNYRAKKAVLPEIELINLCQESRVEGLQAFFAEKTLNEIKRTLDGGDQVMVYLNRRGFASFLVCQDCGEVNSCPECSITLTVHKRSRKIKCHLCGHQEDIPMTCGKCHGPNLQGVGAGTESLEDELPKIFPDAKCLRLDRDQVTSQTRLEKVLESFRKGHANLLLGTQMLVKGHDFPGVTLVVVVLADSLFRWPDFRAPERAYQVLKQVSGRAGRGEKRGRVLIQTFDPDHLVLRTLIGQSSESEFLEHERFLRKELQYPPFGRMARLRFEESVSAQAQSHGRQMSDWLRRQVRELRPESDLEVLGPTEAFLEKVKGVYRWDVMVRSKGVSEVQFAMKMARSVLNQEKWNCQMDVDPSSIG